MITDFTLNFFDRSDEFILVIDGFWKDGQQHKIMNFKLEDFDMVKTIGTGEKNNCRYILS